MPMDIGEIERILEVAPLVLPVPEIVLVPDPVEDPLPQPEPTHAA